MHARDAAGERVGGVQRDGFRAAVPRAAAANGSATNSRYLGATNHAAYAHHARKPLMPICSVMRSPEGGLVDLGEVPMAMPRSA